MTLTELWDELDQHDWFYPMSDDGSVYRAGQANKARLEAIAAQVEGGKELAQRFAAHHFSGKPWGTEQVPKPPRP